MTTIEEMYQRYNSMLAYSIKKFYEDNKGMLLQEDPAIKKVALLKLKPLLDTSAIITKKLPEEYVPLQKPIKKIYALLYTHTFLRKSYLELLESENLARIRAAEQQIVQEIERALAKGTSTTIPKELKTRAATTHATILGKLLALAPAQKPFARTIYLLILLTGFNITSGCISQEAIRKKAWPGWEPIICALNEEEKITQNCRKSPIHGLKPVVLRTLAVEGSSEELKISH